METTRARGVEGGGEVEKKPRYRLMITRHAERLPSGELSPEGIAHAKQKGQAMKGAEVMKGYASDHPSGRAFDTVESISQEAGISSPVTGERYATRKVLDIQYDVLKPDLAYVISNAKDRIEEATLQELGMSTERDAKGRLKINIEKLPKDEQIRIAPVRQKYQRLGFEYVLGESAAVHRMAIGLAHELADKLRLMERYDATRQKANKPAKKDVIINEGTHGMFPESFLKEAGILVRSDGTEVHGISDFASEEFGGPIQPLESIYLEIDDPQHIPDRIPVTFEGNHRLPQGRVFIDRKKLEALTKDYQVWKTSTEKKS